MKKKAPLPDNYIRYKMMWDALGRKLWQERNTDDFENRIGLYKYPETIVLVQGLMDKILDEYETYRVRVLSSWVMKNLHVTRAVLADARRRGKLKSQGKWGVEHTYLVDDIIAWAKERRNKNGRARKEFKTRKESKAKF